jgi:hypothetical protein
MRAGYEPNAPQRTLAWAKRKFLELVDKELLPKAVMIDGLRIWDRLDLNAAFEAAKEETLDTSSDRNPAPASCFS